MLAAPLGLASRLPFCLPRNLGHTHRYYCGRAPWVRPRRGLSTCDVVAHVRAPPRLHTCLLAADLTPAPHAAPARPARPTGAGPAASGVRPARGEEEAGRERGRGGHRHGQGGEEGGAAAAQPTHGAAALAGHTRARRLCNPPTARSPTLPAFLPPSRRCCWRWGPMLRCRCGRCSCRQWRWAAGSRRRRRRRRRWATAASGDSSYSSRQVHSRDTRREQTIMCVAISHVFLNYQHGCDLPQQRGTVRGHMTRPVHPCPSSVPLAPSPLNPPQDGPCRWSLVLLYSTHTGALAKVTFVQEYDTRADPATPHVLAEAVTSGAVQPPRPPLKRHFAPTWVPRGTLGKVTARVWAAEGKAAAAAAPAAAAAAGGGGLGLLVDEAVAGEYAEWAAASRCAGQDRTWHRGCRRRCPFASIGTRPCSRHSLAGMRAWLPYSTE